MATILGTLKASADSDCAHKLKLRHAPKCTSADADVILMGVPSTEYTIDYTGLSVSLNQVILL